MIDEILCVSPKSVENWPGIRGLLHILSVCIISLYFAAFLFNNIAAFFLLAKYYRFRVLISSRSVCGNYVSYYISNNLVRVAWNCEVSHYFRRLIV